MNQAPNIISTKDLAYLEDIFQWNFNACKKAQNDVFSISNEQVKEMINNVAVMHKNHCEKITQILGGYNE